MSEKENFLRNKLVALIETLNADAKPQWGALSVQQMTEHLADSFRNYHGLDSKKLLTPAEHLPKMKEFLMSEKPFKPNTKNIEMPEIPAPPKQPDMQSAINELKTEINNFFSFFEKNPFATITNVFFGELNYTETIQLLHKHSMHHMKQFGLVE